MVAEDYTPEEPQDDEPELSPAEIQDKFKLSYNWWDDDGNMNGLHPLPEELRGAEQSNQDQYFTLKDRVPAAIHPDTSEFVALRSSQAMKTQIQAAAAIQTGIADFDPGNDFKLNFVEKNEGPRYVGLFKTIGEGGFGGVYKMWDRKTG